jgi:hypothetical protein
VDHGAQEARRSTHQAEAPRAEAVAADARLVAMQRACNKTLRATIHCGSATVPSAQA